MNIHHLELFYYVARHGGITEAVRNIPYGIQQPAMSGQIIQLEESLGVTLFQRRPFALTPQGEELYLFIKPFFGNVAAMADKLRGGISQHIRIGASEVVLRDHLPHILQAVRRQYPKLKLTLREGYQPQLEDWVQRQEVDLAFTLLGGKAPPGAHSLALFKMPLVLLVERNSRLKSARQLWEMDHIKETLISLPTSEAIYKSFQQGLGRLKVDWFTGIEVSSVELVETYVANGYGIGLSVAIPKAIHRSEVRLLPLDGFTPVTFGVLWQRKPTPMIQAVLNEVRKTLQALLS